MNRLRIYQYLPCWCRLLIIICCIGLTACKKPPLDIVKPLIDISHADRSVDFEFEIEKPGNYQFALLFATDWKENDREERELLGEDADSGTVLPVSLRLIKDGKPFLDKRIDSVGTLREYVHYKEDGRSWVPTRVRNIDILQLPRGHYSAEISTVQDTPAFDFSMVFVQVISFTPEGLAHNKKQIEEHEKKWESKWYGAWYFTKWLVKGCYCVLFCPEPLDIFKPIDVTHAGQSVRMDFEITETEHYRFALLFNQDDVYEEGGGTFRHNRCSSK